MVDVCLQPMRDDEWNRWRSRAIQLHIDDMMRIHAVPADEAKETAPEERVGHLCSATQRWHCRWARSSISSLKQTTPPMGPERVAPRR